MNRQLNADQSTFIPLEELRVASPCRADWDKMQGDDRTRFCGTCAKNVYNLSAMSQEEAEYLIREKEGQLCVRFYQREDGTILTDNCPVGLKIVRRPFQWLGAGLAALLASGAAIVHGQNTLTKCPQPNAATPNTSLRDRQPFKLIFDYFDPQPMIMGEIAPSMGKIAVPKPTPNPTPQPTPQPTLGEVMMGTPLPLQNED